MPPERAQHRLYGLPRVTGDPDTEERERKLDERSLEGSLEMLAGTIGEHVVEPRVAKKERGRDRSGRRRPRSAARDAPAVTPRAAASATSKPTQATSQW